MAIQSAFWHPHLHRPSRSTNSTVKSHSEDIPSLRAALYAIDAKIQALFEQKRVIAKKLSSAVANQLPIYRLPDELLAKCFSIGVRDNVAPFNPFPSDSEDTLYISRILLVCRHWNRLACSTPTLWNTITVSDSSSNTLSKARLRIKRSKAVPLDVAVSFRPRKDGHSSGDPIMRAMELLSTTISRWRTFRMRVPNPVHAHSALKLCNSSGAPLLEAFSVQITNALQDNSYISPPRNLFQGHTPRLIACYMTTFEYDWEQRLWHGLKVLKLDGYWNSLAPTGMQLRSILESCPSLEELFLRNMSDLEPECDELAAPKAQPLPMLTLHRLHTLSLHYAGGLRAAILLGSLAFPSLRTLEISVMDSVTPVIEALSRQALSAITPMNLAVGLPLENLRIESCYFDEYQFLKLLKRVPTIRKLSLVDLDDITSNTLNVSRLRVYIHRVANNSRFAGTLYTPERSGMDSSTTRGT